MKKAMFIPICLILSTVMFAQNRSNSSAKNAAEQEVLALHESFADAYVQNDVKAIEKIYIDDFLFIGSDGKEWTKQEMLAIVEDGTLRHHDIQYEDVQIRTFDNTAVVTGKWKARATWKESNKESASDGLHAFTFVYHNKKGQWKMVAAHFSPLQQ